MLHHLRSHEVDPYFLRLHSLLGVRSSHLRVGFLDLAKLQQRVRAQEKSDRTDRELERILYGDFRFHDSRYTGWTLSRLRRVLSRTGFECLPEVDDQDEFLSVARIRPVVLPIAFRLGEQIRAMAATFRYSARSVRFWVLRSLVRRFYSPRAEIGQGGRAQRILDLGFGVSLAAFRPGFFDVIRATRILELSPPNEAEALLVRCYKSLALGGRLVIRTMDARKALETADDLKNDPAVAEMCDRQIYCGVDGEPARSLWTERMARLRLARAGFRSISVSYGRQGDPYAEAEIEIVAVKASVH
jgi:hypothetical protein